MELSGLPVGHTRLLKSSDWSHLTKSTGEFSAVPCDLRGNAVKSKLQGLVKSQHRGEKAESNGTDRERVGTVVKTGTGKEEWN